MLIISFAVILVALCLIVMGLRGRVGGEDAKRPRRPRFIWAGILILLFTFIGDGILFGPRLRHYDWWRWKTLAGLFQEIEAGPGPRSVRAVNELNRRILSPKTAREDVDQIVDRALEHQADRSGTWDPTWAIFIDAAGSAKLLTPARANKYLENAVSASLLARPKARRGQPLPVALTWKIDRIAPHPKLLSQFLGANLMLDSAAIAPDFVPASKNPDPGLGLSYQRTVLLKDSDLAGLSDGTHRLATRLQVKVGQMAPFSIRPLTVNIPLSMPLELSAADALVDDFKVDPQQRASEHGAILDARVTHDASGDLDVRVKASTMPVAMAMKVVLTQGQAEQEAGALVIQTSQPPKWHTVIGQQTPKFIGPVDIHLQPAQAVADLQLTLGTYWGEEIVIHDVQVDAPYQAPFLHDESLRAAVEKCVHPMIRRDPESGRLLLQVGFFSAPVKLSYICALAWNGHEMLAAKEPWNLDANETHGWRAVCEDVDQYHATPECSVILRPNQDWEKSSNDLNPPWDGEVVIPHVKIELINPSP